MTTKTILVMFHDDDCDALLDADGNCPKCGFAPDGQSVGFQKISRSAAEAELELGHTLMGLYRTPIRRSPNLDQQHLGEML